MVLGNANPTAYWKAFKGFLGAEVDEAAEVFTVLLHGHRLLHLVTA